MPITKIIRRSVVHFLMLFPIASASAQTDSINFLQSFGNGGVISYAYTTDFKQVLVSTRDGRVKLYDLATGNMDLAYPGTWEYPSIKRSSSGKLVCIASSDSTGNFLYIFEMKTGVLVADFKMASSYGNFSFSANDSVLLGSARGNADSRVCIINLYDKSISSFTTNYWTTPQLSPDGKMLLYGHRTTVDSLFYRNEKGTIVWKYVNELFDNYGFLPDGTILVQPYAKDKATKGLMVVDTATGASQKKVMEKYTFAIPYKQSYGVPRPLQYQPSPLPWDGRVVFTPDGSLWGVWDMKSDSLITLLNLPSARFRACLGFTEDGSNIVFENIITHDLSFWNATTGDSAGLTPTAQSPFNGECRNPQLSDDGTMVLASRTLYVSDPDPLMKYPIYIPQLWDANSGAIIRSFPGFASIIQPRLSPDGRYMATSFNIDTIMLWDIASGKLAGTFTTGRAPANYYSYTMNLEFKNGGSTLFGVVAIDSTVTAPTNRYKSIGYWWDIAKGNLSRKTPVCRSDDFCPKLFSSSDCSRYLVVENFGGPDYLCKCGLYNSSNDSLIGNYKDSTFYFCCASSDLTTVIYQNRSEWDFSNQTRTERFDLFGKVTAISQSFDKSRYFVFKQGQCARIYISDKYYNLIAPDSYNWNYVFDGQFSKKGFRVLMNNNFNNVPLLYDLSFIPICISDFTTNTVKESQISLVSFSNSGLQFLVPLANRMLRLDIYSPTGRLTAHYTKTSKAKPSMVFFSFPGTISSGMYLYKIYAGEDYSNGKFILSSR